MPLLCTDDHVDEAPSLSVRLLAAIPADAPFAELWSGLQRNGILKPARAGARRLPNDCRALGGVPQRANQLRSEKRVLHACVSLAGLN